MTLLACLAHTGGGSSSEAREGTARKRSAARGGLGGDRDAPGRHRGDRRCARERRGIVFELPTDRCPVDWSVTSLLVLCRHRQASLSAHGRSSRRARAERHAARHTQSPLPSARARLSDNVSPCVPFLTLCIRLGLRRRGRSSPEAPPTRARPSSPPRTRKRRQCATSGGCDWGEHRLCSLCTWALPACSSCVQSYENSRPSCGPLVAAPAPSANFVCCSLSAAG